MDLQRDLRGLSNYYFLLLSFVVLGEFIIPFLCTCHFFLYMLIFFKIWNASFNYSMVLSLTYKLGLLCQVITNWTILCPFREKIDMAVRLFHALKVESQTLRFVIQEATISLAAAYKVCTFLFCRCECIVNLCSLWKIFF